MPYLVTKDLLKLHDEYDGDLGLLDERWAFERDRTAFSAEQIQTLGEYINTLNLANVEGLSEDLQARTTHRLQELEKQIKPEVILILRDRIAAPSTNRKPGEQASPSTGG
jgi:hypothetical protein